MEEKGEQSCRGTLKKNGKKCTYKAGADGYCGHHKQQVRTRKNSKRAARPTPGKAVISPVSRELMISADDRESIVARLQTIIDLYAIRDKLFIGKASGGNPPEKRWSQKYEVLGYERMQVLCEVPRVEDALWLERRLIAHFKSEDGVNVQNPIAGGGGAKGKDQGYVYLVIG